MAKIRRTTTYLIVDLVIGALFVLETLSGLVMMFVLTGGYQGGRNPGYGRTLILDRHGWETLHAWGGLLMAAMVLLHVIMHWRWIVGMARSYRRNFYQRPRPAAAAPPGGN